MGRLLVEARNSNRCGVIAIVQMPNDLLIETRTFLKSYEPGRSGSVVAQEV